MQSRNNIHNWIRCYRLVVHNSNKIYKLNQVFKTENLEIEQEPLL